MTFRAITNLLKSGYIVVQEAAVYLHKTKCSMERLVNKSHPIEFQGEFKAKSDNDNINDLRSLIRQATIKGDLKRKYTF